MGLACHGRTRSQRPFPLKLCLFVNGPFYFVPISECWKAVFSSDLSFNGGVILGPW